MKRDALFLLCLLFLLNFVLASTYVQHDYDGDGKADLGVYSPSTQTWYIKLSGGGGLTQQYGARGDIPIPGNYFPQNKECYSDHQCDDNWDCSADSCLGSVCLVDYSDCECQFTSDCDDGNICTTNMCSNGECVTENNQNTCSDGNLCTFNDVCSGGVCSGIQNTCSDGWDCSVDTCNLIDGSCSHVTDSCSCAESSSCDDGNICTTNTCSNGQCTTENNSVSCNDNNNCTINDVCSGGVCSGVLKDISDGNLLTIDKCLANGTVIHTRSFNIEEHLENKDSSVDSSLVPSESTLSGMSNTENELNQSSSSSSTSKEGSSTTSSSQGDDDGDNVRSSIIVLVAILALVAVGFIIFILPGFLKKNNGAANGSIPVEPMSKMPPRRPRSRSVSRMPPRRTRRR